MLTIETKRMEKVLDRISGLNANDDQITRFKAVMAGLRTLGAIARTNYRSCCRSCASYEMYQDERIRSAVDEGIPVVWTYSGQGHDTATELENGVAYLNHSNLSDDFFSTMRVLFEKAGFRAEWDGTEMSCVLISDSLSG